MPAKIPDQLKEIANHVSQGGERSETVRTLLSWFEAERRGYWKVQEIRKALRKLKLKTEPDFEDAWIDAPIAFVTKRKKEKAPPSTESEPTPDTEPTVEEETGGAPIPSKYADGVHSRIKIGVLAAANKPPLCISPDAGISEAITLMLQHDFSQLPVTTTERDVKGIISWKSLGSRLALGKQCKKVRECMEPQSEIRSDASLSEPILIMHSCRRFTAHRPTRNSVATRRPSASAAISRW
jgi:CBS domain-containing protein